MEIPIGTQTIALTAAAVCGASSGLLYDLLRAIRRGASRSVQTACDLFFCLFCTGVMFLLGMVFCEGRPGVWEGTVFLVGFGLYLFGVSPSIAPFFGICREKCADFLKNRRKKVK